MMLVLMFMAVPVAVALAVPSIVGVYAISGVPAAVNVLSVAPYNAVSSWSMGVLPMFIFMGMLMSNSGMTSRVYTAASRWFSWLPAGLAVGTTAAGAGLASVSGSTIGMTYALGRAGIPEMLRQGYDRRIAVGAIIVSGLPGNLIPPSILLVVYAGIASVPIGPQLVAGVVPGILIIVFYAVFLLVLGLLVPRLFGRGVVAPEDEQRVTWRQRFESLASVWGIPLIMLVLFGGMFSGAFTPTEAGVAAAMTSLLLLLWYTRKDRPFHKLGRAAVETVSATGAIFFILIGAEMLTRLLSITGLARITTDLIADLGLERLSLLLVLVVFYLIMGMFFDTLSMMLLTIPILLPTLDALAISPIWFGVFIVLLCELGMITPPLGILSYIVHNIAKAPEVNLGQHISLKDVFVSLVWFLPISALFLAVMILFPGMTEWLGNVLESAGGP